MNSFIYKGGVKMKQTEFKIKVPKSICIGDEYYIERAESESRYKTLIFDQKIPPNFIGKIHIQDRTEEKETTPKTNIIKIVFAFDETFKVSDDGNKFKEEAFVDMLLNGYYPSRFHTTPTTLGCDTASFDIYVDDNYTSLNTLSDGYYGEAILYKDGITLKGISIELFITEHAYDYEDILNIFEYLFKKI